MVYTLFRLLPAQPGVPQREEAIYVSSEHPLDGLHQQHLMWLVRTSYEPDNTRPTVPFLQGSDVLEIGPSNAFETPWCSNARSICTDCVIPGIRRIERSVRYRISDQPGCSREEILKRYLDKMTQAIYDEPPSFEADKSPDQVRTYNVLTDGIEALRLAKKEVNLVMDEVDMEFYLLRFTKLRHNPTDVELKTLDGANCDHARHRKWKGTIYIGGVKKEHTLMQLAMAPLAFAREQGDDNVLAGFNDNSGVVKGFTTRMLVLTKANGPSVYVEMELEIVTTGTAETHNHPSTIEPYAGAGTGVGGRERDTECTGRGSEIGIGGVGYCVANLFISGHEIDGEVAGRDRTYTYASPIEILVHGSQGAMDYSNEMGEPLLVGFTYTFGQTIGDIEYGYDKCILFASSAGRMRRIHVKKQPPQKGQLIITIGGPVARVGVGGSGASSGNLGESEAKLDYDSVQRPDAMMAQKMRRVIEACISLGKDNPILSIHDYGAAGPSNVLPELAGIEGLEVDVSKFVTNDPTMSDLEKWVAESQERAGLTIDASRLGDLQAICEREGVNCEVLGSVTGDGRVVLKNPATSTCPVNLPIVEVYEGLPAKEFHADRIVRDLKPVDLPEDLTVAEALAMVMTRIEVGSKGTFTRHGDRSVGGRTWGQQHHGIADIPIGDYASQTNGFGGFEGIVKALGTQPYVMLLAAEQGMRMGIAEAVIHLAMSPLASLRMASMRVNWMVSFNDDLPRLHDAASAGSEFMKKVGLKSCGGKDSPSMKTKGGVIAPMTCVFTAYGSTPDVRKCMMPAIQKPGESRLYLVDLGKGKDRLGGSILAVAHNRLGAEHEAPDVDADSLLNIFDATKSMINGNAALAMHDRSEGGLIITVAEMCMASNCGFRLNAPGRVWSTRRQLIAWLFNQEAGAIVEVEDGKKEDFERLCHEHDLPCELIGVTTVEQHCEVWVDESCELRKETCELRHMWERTSSAIDALRINPEYAAAELLSYAQPGPSIMNPKAFRLSHMPKWTSPEILMSPEKFNVAVIRAPGSNGDKELAASLKAAGFNVWDVNMKDLVSGHMPDLDRFHMLAYPGGFSYRDVFGAGKGWAGVVRFNERVRSMFERYYDRPDTISLGPCNGCQFIPIAGLLSFGMEVPEEKQPRFVQNKSHAFESRLAKVLIPKNCSIFLEGMEGDMLPVDVDHGEGRLVVPDHELEAHIVAEGLIPMVYIGDDGQPTEQYPLNPSGTKNGWAGLISGGKRRGRDLAIMPHPERGLYAGQRWMPENMRDREAENSAQGQPGPWLRIFQNARAWLDKNAEKIKAA